MTTPQEPTPIWRVTVDTPTGGVEMHTFDTIDEAERFAAEAISEPPVDTRALDLERKKQERLEQLRGRPRVTHPSHDFHADDDVMACDACSVRTYHSDALESCPAIAPTTYLHERMAMLERESEYLADCPDQQADVLTRIAVIAQQIHDDARLWIAYIAWSK